MILGMTGKARSGKDTVADLLVKEYGFVRVGWADLLKKGICIWHGWDDRHAYGDLKEVIDEYFGYSPREAFQGIGTDLMRDQWMSDFWTRCALRHINTLLDAGRCVVVSDCRFDNEAMSIKDLGGEVWKVEREAVSLEAGSDHASEQGVDPALVSTSISNNDTIDSLYEKVRVLMRSKRTT